MEDSFSMVGVGGGLRMISEGDRNLDPGWRAAVNTDQASLALPPLCNPVPNRPWTSAGLWSGGWGPLI